MIGQLGWPDMRLPLLYSISWPHRIPMSYKPLDLVQLGSLTFKAPDNKKYPCIELAYAAGKEVTCLYSLQAFPEDHVVVVLALSLPLGQAARGAP